MAQKVDQRYLFSPETGPIVSAVKPYIAGGEGKAPRLMGWLMPDHEGRLLAVPDNIVGFSLKVLVPKSRGIIGCQRDYALNQYVPLGRSPEEAPAPDLEWQQPQFWIEVLENQNWGLYTAWQADRNNPLTTNNVGLWEIDEENPGKVTFWKVGIVSPNGRDFYLIHEKSWDGTLYSIEAAQGYVVGVPSEPRFGPFEPRAAILEYEAFIDALPPLPSRKDANDLEQPLALPEDQSIVVDWYNPFMGMGRGQGIVRLADYSSAWLRGQDVENLDPNKPVYLARGTRLELIPRSNGKVIVNDMGKTPRVVGACLIAEA